MCPWHKFVVPEGHQKRQKNAKQMPTAGAHSFFLCKPLGLGKSGLERNQRKIVSFPEATR
jgi:hypothetical protein